MVAVKMQHSTFSLSVNLRCCAVSCVNRRLILEAGINGKKREGIRKTLIRPARNYQAGLSILFTDQRGTGKRQTYPEFRPGYSLAFVHS